MKLLFLLALLGVTNAACTSVQADAKEAARGLAAASSVELVRLSDVEWGPLNPARGDRGPRAGALWGDRTGPGPSGFLVEFTDGFESPPHIHNVSYRGAVISGLLHNDDPGAEEMWMPSGSFWTQPRGAVHITSARGPRNLAYIEIEEGPYLVRPVEQQFRTEELPVNVAPSNLVWVDPPGEPASIQGPKVAYLWGSVQEGERSGMFVRLPAGFEGELRSHGSTLHAVVIQGRLACRLPSGSGVEVMEPGSAFRSEGGAVHRISCPADTECVIYVRAEGRVDVARAQLSSGPGEER